MIKIFLFFILCISYLSNANADLMVKIDRQKLALYQLLFILMVKIKILSLNIKKIIEADLYNSGYFNILSSKM